MTSKKSKGQATLEAALLLPVLFMLVFGIIAIGWWMNVQQVATNAAAEAAAVGSVSNSNCDIVAVARNAMKGVVNDVNSISVGVSPKRSDQRPPGTIMTVQVSYPLSMSFNFVSTTFSKVVANSAARMDYYTEDGSPFIPPDPDCSGANL